MSTITEKQLTPVAPVNIEPGRLFIDGRWCDSALGETAATINSATEQQITTVAKTTVEDARRTAAAAARAFEQSGWATLRESERAKVLQRVADLIEQNAHELAYRAAVNMGTLYQDAAHVVVLHIANMFRYYSGWPTKPDGSVRPAEPLPGSSERLLAFTRGEPLGSWPR